MAEAHSTSDHWPRHNLQIYRRLFQSCRSIKHYLIIILLLLRQLYKQIAKWQPDPSRSGLKDQEDRQRRETSFWEIYLLLLETESGSGEDLVLHNEPPSSDFTQTFLPIRSPGRPARVRDSTEGERYKGSSLLVPFLC